MVTAVPSGGNFNSTIVHHGNAPAVSLHASPLLRTQLLAELIKNTTETLAAEIITIISKDMLRITFRTNFHTVKLECFRNLSQVSK